MFSLHARVVAWKCHSVDKNTPSFARARRVYVGFFHLRAIVAWVVSALSRVIGRGMKDTRPGSVSGRWAKLPATSGGYRFGDVCWMPSYPPFGGCAGGTVNATRARFQPQVVSAEPPADDRFARLLIERRVPADGGHTWQSEQAGPLS
jgi:hypothetical protein